MEPYASPEQEWHDLLAGTHPHFQHQSRFRFVPAAPRCRLCRAPFRAPGALIFRRYGFVPWEKNPNVCKRCFRGLHDQAKACPAAAEGREVRGAEIEISMLFADVRGSSKLARTMPVAEFTDLMNRFYRVSRNVLIDDDAIIEKFVGDEVVGLFIPCMTGPGHAARAVEAAEHLMRATGHGSSEAPWAPIGAGVHTGSVFVGMVGSEDAADFTALGDPMNVAAHLADQAAVGEILVTDEAATAAGIDRTGLERRSLSLKGYPVDAVVMRTTSSEPSPTG